MKKSDILASLERIPGDPEIEITVVDRHGNKTDAEIDRINEFPRPEIVVIKK